MAAPQVTEYTGVVPLRTQEQSVFSTNTGNLLTWWPTSVPEMNTLATFVNDQAESAASSANLADSVVTAANFKGEWSSLTGALTVPSTVYHSGTYWQLLDDVADVTLSEPTTINTDWALSAQASDHVVISGTLSLPASGKYYIVGSGTITIPDPTTWPDGKTFNFKRQPNETPTIFVGTDLVTTRLGLTDGILMGVSQHEMITYNGLYEV